MIGNETNASHHSKETIEDYFTPTFQHITRKETTLSPPFVKFLQSVGLESYLKIFKREEIDPEILLQCNFKDLKAVGLRNAAATRILNLRRQILALCLFMAKKRRTVGATQRPKALSYHSFSLLKIDNFHPHVVNYRYR
ncbi:uncharacterized protein Gasu_61840 [Galdieria sulphuraria]|uniref:SAM domain-containing protein n=1 Tax=Galdieria sulphuraria TaxID=130081 RepID=M2VSP7_GALSU|nr:uncharacterized protein Gasu_61840 [Galdieria sulphuraria]EME26171.1 hypothetical protein Gasu_61840 [Galdieria sulphuraria]|eukprot:XP_005702691.1 hypothetical protein Gasu_61840 [Galdieria sulphuraria]